MDLYHVLNRGVDKRIIFNDNQDYLRFIHDMYEFNSTERASSTYRSMFDVGRRTFTPREGEQIVDIHGWCLMGNHYHLLLSERIEGGISLFLKKLNGGYAKYFNERYSRTGALFQGKTKKILVANDAHLLHILNYVHFNALDNSENTANWRTKRIINATEALMKLNNYRWSSYLDYVGISNFSSILTKNFFLEIFDNDYRNQVECYLRDIDIQFIGNITLEH